MPKDSSWPPSAVHKARAGDVPVPHGVVAYAGIDPVGLLLGHDDPDQRGSPGPVAEQVVGGDHIGLELGNEATAPVGRRVEYGLHLLVGDHGEERRHGEIRSARDHGCPQVSHLGLEHRAVGWRACARLMLPCLRGGHRNDDRPR